MKLNDIMNGKVLHGSVKDLDSGDRYGVFTKRMNNDYGTVRKGKDFLKHFTSIELDGISMGYVYYTTNCDVSSFMGLEVFRPNRGGGLAMGLLETYFSICEENDLITLETEKQRKPFTIFLLDKCGYSPINCKSSQKFCVLDPVDDRLNIDFYNDFINRDFGNSKIFKSGQYRIGDMDMEEILVNNLFVHSRYKVKESELSGRRLKNKERFEVSLVR